MVFICYCSHKLTDRQSDRQTHKEAGKNSGITTQHTSATLAATEVTRRTYKYDLAPQSAHVPSQYWFHPENPQHSNLPILKGPLEFSLPHSNLAEMPPGPWHSLIHS